MMQVDRASSYMLVPKINPRMSQYSVFCVSFLMYIYIYMSMYMSMAVYIYMYIYTHIYIYM